MRDDIASRGGSALTDGLGPNVQVQACRPEDRAMLATPAGAELVAKAAAALDAYRCIAPLCKPLGCSDCNCAVPADVYAVLMRAERAADFAWTAEDQAAIDAEDAAARQTDPMDLERRQALLTLAEENYRLRKALESVQHEATSLRVWAGSAWVYHPPQVARIARTCAAALGHNVI